jgi:hypothetical protein
MEYWDISVDMMLKFRTEDIPQIRITLANDLYFSEKNTEDKSLVRNMFLQVFCDSILCCFFGRSYYFVFLVFSFFVGGACSADGGMEFFVFVHHFLV